MVHIRHSLVTQCFICVDCDAWFHRIPHNSLQGHRVCAFDYSCTDLACFAIFDTSNNSLTCYSTSGLLFAFVMGHVLAFAANESFISFNGSRKPRQPCKIESFPNPMGKEPRAFLGDAKITV